VRPLVGAHVSRVLMHQSGAMSERDRRNVSTPRPQEVAYLWGVCLEVYRGGHHAPLDADGSGIGAEVGAAHHATQRGSES